MTNTGSGFEFHYTIIEWIGSALFFVITIPLLIAVIIAFALNDLTASLSEG